MGQPQPGSEKLYVRMMEVYTAALAHSDTQLGRVLENFIQSGQLEKTLFIFRQ
jgi:arylsulfatase A-like enzyme